MRFCLIPVSHRTVIVRMNVSVTVFDRHADRFLKLNWIFHMETVHGPFAGIRIGSFGGTGERDPEFLDGPQGALKSRQAADGEHNDLQGADSESLSGDGVRQLMQQYAHEQPHQKKRVGRSGSLAGDQSR